MDLKNECDEACTAVRGVTKRVSEGSLPDGVEALAMMLMQLQETASAIRECRRLLENEAHARLADAHAGVVTLFDGTTVRRSSRWNRRDVDKDGLITSLRTHPDAVRVDPDTGEIHNDSQAFAELLLKCFRQEPRWKAFEDLGINDEDYCEKEYVATVLVRKPEPGESS